MDKKKARIGRNIGAIWRLATIFLVYITLFTGVPAQAKLAEQTLDEAVIDANLVFVGYATKTEYSDDNHTGVSTVIGTQFFKGYFPDTVCIKWDVGEERAGLTNILDEHVFFLRRSYSDCYELANEWLLEGKTPYHIIMPPALEDKTPPEEKNFAIALEQINALEGYILSKPELQANADVVTPNRRPPAQTPKEASYYNSLIFYGTLYGDVKPQQGLVSVRVKKLWRISASLWDRLPVFDYGDNSFVISVGYPSNPVLSHPHFKRGEEIVIVASPSLVPLTSRRYATPARFALRIDPRFDQLITGEKLKSYLEYFDKEKTIDYRGFIEARKKFWPE